MNKLEYEKLILPLVNLINDIETDLVRNILILFIKSTQ